LLLTQKADNSGFNDIQKSSYNLIKEGSYVNYSCKGLEEIKPKDQNFGEDAEKVNIVSRIGGLNISVGNMFVKLQ
jgi:hypothetical protein